MNTTTTIPGSWDSKFGASIAQPLAGKRVRRYRDGAEGFVLTQDARSLRVRRADGFLMNFRPNTFEVLP
jgi:hypothetical protein